MGITGTIMAVSTLVSAGSSIMSSQSKAGALKRQAASEELAAQGAELQGKQAFASSQRKALNERRQAQLVSSRALAVAASSGAGASDPTVLDIQAGIQGQGEYNAMAALYEGHEANREAMMQAQQLRMGAANDRSQASDTLTAGWLNAGSTILSGGSSLYDKYGASVFGSSAGPSMNNNDWLDVG